MNNDDMVALFDQLPEAASGDQNNLAPHRIREHHLLQQGWDDVDFANNTTTTIDDDPGYTVCSIKFAST